ncbi:phosphoenolpyruvate carboxylase [Fragilariopsis cylindrus CCMP1102]|uniref:phosphoenolpyruvate carboxylase n=1 Tax=Fragilariopsis cylindrus CCMP1102 TaxID=635003 RepID=A0A1E7G010_9STRA|nr:phosphoenolpyruvate carboxylase [Fragilariopsis cylindrus CCMP1102]|eukprot:OEU23739.1 phosphoenolpyruvate carboxylase [Fragilariopsis cylindrus CCMP1102]
MKVSLLTVVALSLLANPSGTFASSSRNRKNTVLPWTTVKKIFNPRGGAASDDTSSDSHVLLGIDEEATESLEVSVPLSQSSTLSKNDAPLTRDIEMLTEILSDLVQHENPKVHDLYEEFIGYGRQRAANPSDETPLQTMIERAKSLTASECLGINRCISTALSLVNSAEVQHRLRAIKQHERDVPTKLPGPLYHMEDSIKGTIQLLLDSEGASKEEIYNQLCSQSVELVLTAHPTEVNRKSVLRKYRKCTELLAYLERPDLLPHEQLTGTLDLQRIVSSVWGMDEIRRNKPTVQKEAAGGLAIIDTSLWTAVPNYLRKLDAQCLASLGKRLPLEVCPIRFASWIGGDRDGNPNVTPQVTREVVLHQRLRAARLYLQDLTELESQLAISSRFSSKMIELASSIPNAFHKRELYRRVISHMRKRLVKTANEIEMKLANEYFQNDPDQAYYSMKNLFGDESDEDVLESVTKAEDLLGPLRIMHESLIETGFDLVADGLLSDIVRRLKVFGITLVPLDIREESTQHTNALDSITRWLGIGSYADWDEDARINWLASELSSRRPLFPSERLQSMEFDPMVIRTLEVFQTASELEPEALGAYVISQCQTASDVLAVMLLQKQFGMTARNGNMMRVAPLFETLNDLNNAPERLKTLFSVPAYVAAINGKQEVMVGYSDSAKDAGRLAACWAQYLSQERMVEVANKAGIELCFFHGKGGTVGRGGNPALYRAVLSHPPNTINGRFRVTEQGEMITQNYGSTQIAEHTLDIYTAAVLRETFTKHVEPTDGWRKQMEKISDKSCNDYRHLVNEEPRFVPYFREATPELELQILNIGSRPAKRNPKGGIESLRAIPWTFAWTQTRTHLSAWLGVGAGLTATDTEDLECLQDMYNSWPWFRELIDLISMIVSKTDFSVSKNYDDQLVSSEESKQLGVEVREKLVQTRQSILDVTQSEIVAGHHVALQRASNSIRAPYVDPLNVIQAELMKRFRALDQREDLTTEEEMEKQTLQDALVVCINGISSGMRNSG